METYARFVLALIFVIALIGLAAAVARRMGFGVMVGGRPRGQRRLGIVEVAALDTRRRLILVRRDDIEHLLLLGATSETIIESGISSPPRSVSPSPGGQDFARALDEARSASASLETES